MLSREVSDVRSNPVRLEGWVIRSESRVSDMTMVRVIGLWLVLIFFIFLFSGFL